VAFARCRDQPTRYPDDVIGVGDLGEKCAGVRFDPQGLQA
jgi:hypothetical protein